MTSYMRERGFDDYDELWRWSVEDLEGFWGVDLGLLRRRRARLRARARVARDARRAVVPGRRRSTTPSTCSAASADDARRDRRTAARTARATPSGRGASCASRRARIAAGLRALGVERGDRVAAYMPNIPETAAAFLASASLGAVWSSCSPDFGARSVIDRFAQIEPKVLLAVDGYRYNGRDFDRRETVDGDRRRDAGGPRASRSATSTASGWDALPRRDGELEFERVPFDHPLWVLYSSGTTGLPKAIVQGQGGILLEHLKKLAPARRRAGRRPPVLVHDDRLDDVELPRLGAAHRGGDRALRRQPGAAGHGRAVGPRGAHGGDDVRHQRRLHRARA